MTLRHTFAAAAIAVCAQHASGQPLPDSVVRIFRGAYSPTANWLYGSLHLSTSTASFEKLDGTMQLAYDGFGGNIELYRVLNADEYFARNKDKNGFCDSPVRWLGVLQHGDDIRISFWPARSGDECMSAPYKLVLDDDATPTGLYYALTPAHLWLISLDGHRPMGQMFDPRGLSARRAICDVRVVGDSLAWRTEATPSNQMRFAGRFTDADFTGYLWMGTNRDSVVFRRALHAGATRRNWAGFYSNMAYSEEAGDMIGTDVMLVPAGDSLLVAVGLGEGTVRGPFVGMHARIHGDSLHFETQEMLITHGVPDSEAHKVGTVTYDALITTGSIIFADTLPLKSSLTHFFATSEQQCRE